MPADRKNIFSELAPVVANKALQAAESGTFGVGGLIIDENGRVLKTMQNRVIESDRIADPTAHVERQLVDWYYNEIAKGADLPPPSGLTVISSLDPCMMCAGSILAAGFNVTSMNFDDFAGVNYATDGKFETLPSELRTQARKHFAYYGVDGETPYYGSAAHPAAGAVIPAGERDAARGAFAASLDSIKQKINAATADMPSAPHAAPPLSSEGLATALVSAARKAESLGGALNAAAILDAEGHLLLVRGGETQISPIRTALITLLRDYTKLRNDRTEEDFCLPHPKNCRIVMLYGPGRTAADIADMGAYGSTMEGPPPESNKQPLQYVFEKQECAALKDMLAHFPPLYRDVIRISPEPVRDQALEAHCLKKISVAKARPSAISSKLKTG